MVSTFSPLSENKHGSDCSGSSGGKNRILTMSNTELTLDNGFMVYASGVALHEEDYTVSHETENSEITFLNNLWDDQPIKVIYFTEAGPTSNHFEGSDATGSDGDTGRTVTLDNSSMTLADGFQVYVGGATLTLTTDYSVSHNTSSSVVTFVNAIADTDDIIIVYYLGTGVYTNNPTEFDFYDGPIKDFGRVLTHTAVSTSVDNITGEKTQTDSTVTRIIGVFQRKNQIYSLNKEGLRMDADAVAYLDKDQTINRNDKITIDNYTYRVDNTLIHYYDGNAIMQEVTLYQF